MAERNSRWDTTSQTPAWISLCPASIRVGAISSVQDVITITQTIRSAMASLSVSFASWEKSVDDQQQLLKGKSFKAIPMQPVSLAFVQEVK